MTGAEDPWTAGLPASLSLRPGQEWRHQLLSAAGAGSSWRLELLDGDAGCAEGHVVLEPGPVPSARPGGPPPQAYGVPEVAVIRGVRPGRARWRLRLAQPWAPDEPAVEHVLEIRVG